MIVGNKDIITKLGVRNVHMNTTHKYTEFVPMPHKDPKSHVPRYCTYYLNMGFHCRTTRHHFSVNLTMKTKERLIGVLILLNIY